MSVTRQQEKNCLLLYQSTRYVLQCLCNRVYQEKRKKD